MSEDRDLDSVVTVSTDGISVEKCFEREDFAVPAVEFTVRSDRTEPTTIRLVDTVPEDFPMDSVGFHPEYYNDDWTAFKDHRVEFEREISPGEEIVTVYGVRLSETDDISDFMGEPELADESADSDADADAGDVPPGPLSSIIGDPDGPMDGNTITDIVSEEGNQVVRDVLTGDRDTLPGLDDDAGEPTDSGTEDPLEAAADPLGDLGGPMDSGDVPEEPSDAGDHLGEPAPESLEAAESTETADSADDSEPTVEPADVEVDPTPVDGADGSSEIVTAEPAEPDLPAAGNVASALAEEIREGAVSDGDLTVLRQELDVALPESTNVRIRHLQSRVEDLTAYTEALEGFIDENGTANQVLEEFEAFEDEVSQLDDELGNLEAEIDDVQGFDDERQAIDVLEDSVETLQSEQADTDERLATLESEMASISGHVDKNSEQLHEIQDDLTDIQELQADIESIQNDIDDLSDLEARLDAIEDLEERVAAIEGIEERVESIEALEDRLEALEEDDDQLEAVEDLRTEIAAVRTEFGEIEELVGANTEDLTAIDSTLSNVEAELAGVTDVEGDLRSIDDRLETLSESLESTERTLESSVSDLQAEVATITDDVEEIRTWRDQLKGVFGAGDG